MTRRVIVCGGRTFADRALVHAIFRRFLSPGDVVVHGAGRGADALAGETAEALGYETEPHPALWAVHGKAAGPIRNREMLGLGADLVIAFPGGTGTADMKTIARTARVPVLEVWREDPR